MMTDWQGRQVGDTQETYGSLVKLGRQMNETNDLVLWEINENLIRRVIGVVTPGNDKIKCFRI